MADSNKQKLRTAMTVLLAMWLLEATPSIGIESALDLREIYRQKVDRQLIVPEEEQRFYAEHLSSELLRAGLIKLSAQYVVLVDRSPKVQALLLFWMSDTGLAEYIGASPVSTGRRGGFMFYETPLGVFDHTVANLDYRALGTKNGLGILGFGVKGTRVYDFGWVGAHRTWKPGEGKMRLELHSTDPHYLEPRLGTVQSMGCIRIPATLNALIDHYGILDADYERAKVGSRHFWMLKPDREPTPWLGRYLVVIDSNRDSRPAWSPEPNMEIRLPKVKPSLPPSPIQQ
jgi:hypothetical protein